MWTHYELYFGLMEFAEYRVNEDETKYQVKIEQSITATHAEGKKIEIDPKNLFNRIPSFMDQHEDVTIVVSDGYELTNGDKYVPGNAWLVGWKNTTKDVFNRECDNAMGPPSISKKP